MDIHGKFATKIRHHNTNELRGGEKHNCKWLIDHKWRDNHQATTGSGTNNRHRKKGLTCKCCDCEFDGSPTSVTEIGFGTKQATAPYIVAGELMSHVDCEFKCAQDPRCAYGTFYLHSAHHTFQSSVHHRAAADFGACWISKTGSRSGGEVCEDYPCYSFSPRDFNYNGFMMNETNMYGYEPADVAAHPSTITDLRAQMALHAAP
jgi:hypothetical protein